MNDGICLPSKENELGHFEPEIDTIQEDKQGYA